MLSLVALHGEVDRGGGLIPARGQVLLSDIGAHSGLYGRPNVLKGRLLESLL